MILSQLLHKSGTVVPIIRVYHAASAVAPCGVFVHAHESFLTGGINLGRHDVIHTAKVTWSFGDSGSSHNSMDGAFASHVYESSGNYTITCTIVDANGVSGQATYPITVNAFSGTTYYASAAGDDGTGDGSISTPWRSFDKVMSTIETDIAGDSTVEVRGLFNRGDTFNVAYAERSSLTSRGTSGAAIIGAYGSGAKPIINATWTTSGGALWEQGAGGTRVTNWSWVDLDIQGPYTWSNAADAGHPSAWQFWKGDWRVILRCEVTNCLHGLVSIGAADVNEQVGSIVFDSTFYEMSQYHMFFGGRMWASVGNDCQKGWDTHLIRMFASEYGVLNDTIAYDPDQDEGLRLALRIQPDFDGEDRADYVWIAQNSFRGGIWSIQIGPPSTSQIGIVKHVVFERNTVAVDATSPVATQVGVQAMGTYLTFRNNVQYGNNRQQLVPMFGLQRYQGIPVSDIWIYGNTQYHPAATGGSDYQALVQFGEAGTGGPQLRNIQIVGNVLEHAQATGVIVYDTLTDVPDAELTCHHNLVFDSSLDATTTFANWGSTNYTLATWQSGGWGTGSVKDDDPLLTDPGNQDVSLGAGSPALGAGVAYIGLFDDLDGTSRPSPPDMGAQGAASGVPTASGVSISGTTKQGQTLTGNYTYAGANPEGTSTYRWLRDDAPIAGATSQTYLLVLADVGASIKFGVTPVDDEATAGDEVVSVGTSAIQASGSGAAAGAASAYTFFFEDY